jgi:hypothetical protein
LGVEDRFIEGTWEWLNNQERSDLLRVFEAALYRGRVIALTITGGTFPAKLNTGMSIDGTPITTGMTVTCPGSRTLTTGEIVNADTVEIPRTYLDQSDWAMEQVRNGFAHTQLRFRVEAGPATALSEG